VRRAALVAGAIVAASLSARRGPLAPDRAHAEVSAAGAEEGERLTGPDAASPRHPRASPARVSFLAVGDIMLSRRVAWQMRRARDLLLPFRGVAELCASVDFTFGNLEAPFSASERFDTSAANLFNTPPAHVRGLVEHRFRVLALANNHAFDQGEAGVRFTVAHLDAHGLAHVGAGASLDDAWRPAVIELRGIRIGFVAVSYASVNDLGVTRTPHVARMDERERFARVLGELRPKVGYLVVAMHAGNEWATRPNAAQIALARTAVDLGADVVLGHHPHVAQPVERYRDKPIFYSLGNFIFDQDPEASRRGLTVRIRLRAAAERAVVEHMEVVPVVIERRCAPRPATPFEARAILDGIGLPHPQIEPPP
jgi:poly-gamma-glutamate synthesis protein (capsule biosynthesis protein)